MIGRRQLLTVAAVAALAPVLSACGGSGGSDGTVRIDAIFDNASFVGTGQDVRVAGANVGKVSDVTLTGDRRARISMNIDKKFTPFRANADCTILPQSLIGEKFVECDPGRPDQPELVKGSDPAPTVPLDNNSSPVDLDLVVAMLGQPTNVRFQLLTNEFGAGLAGRGEDLSAAIRRANPTLKYARQTLDVLGADKAALGRVIEATDEILGELDRRKDDLAGTFEASSKVLKVSSDYRAALDRALKELPPTLRDLRPALQSLRDLTRDATPTLASLRRASPSLRQLAGDLEPLSDAARPALRSLAKAARVGVPVLQRAAPQLERLRQVVASLAPIAPLAGDLNRSLSDNGVPELLSLFVFNVSMATARFDSVSHILPAHVNLGGTCIAVSSQPQAGCSAKFADEGTPAATGHAVRQLSSTPPGATGRAATRRAPSGSASTAGSTTRSAGSTAGRTAPQGARDTNAAQRAAAAAGAGR
ncbi:MlaD family protein [Patulibacter medicamentivorans]|uniref:MlaD family protein n=1 Tax=Patulibacter medicamentivorans TaxID=1097667 RepID=UPI00031211CD|nr:MlaD family protein [Patulibacter medicamentivorans]